MTRIGENWIWTASQVLLQAWETKRLENIKSYTAPYTAPAAAQAPWGHELSTFKGHTAHTMTVPAGTGHHLTRGHVSTTRLSDHTVCPLHSFFPLGDVCTSSLFLAICCLGGRQALWVPTEWQPVTGTAPQENGLCVGGPNV